MFVLKDGRDQGRERPGALTDSEAFFFSKKVPAVKTLLLLAQPKVHTASAATL